MKIAKLIFLLPSFPLMLLAAMYFLIKIIKETGWVEFTMTAEEDRITPEIKEYVKTHIPKAIMYLFSLCGWLTIIFHNLV